MFLPNYLILMKNVIPSPMPTSSLVESDLFLRFSKMFPWRSPLALRIACLRSSSRLKASAIVSWSNASIVSVKYFSLRNNFLKNRISFILFFPLLLKTGLQFLDLFFKLRLVTCGQILFYEVKHRLCVVRCCHIDFKIIQRKT
jgi:hypothetical protein